MVRVEKLLVGTGNQSKLSHYRQYFEGTNIHLVGLADVGISDEPEETGETFEENAVLKARFYCKKSGLPALSDDAGFEIPALGNFPGVKSNRFAGHKMSEQEVIDGILKKMSGLQGEDRLAVMKVVVALAFPDGKTFVESGFIKGIVPEKPYPKTEIKFPYRSLLYLPTLEKWFYEISPQEEDQLGYRKSAVQKIKSHLT